MFAKSSLGDGDYIFLKDSNKIFLAYHLIVWLFLSFQALFSELEILWLSWGFSQSFLLTKNKQKHSKTRLISSHFLDFTRYCNHKNNQHSCHSLSSKHWAFLYICKWFNILMERAVMLCPEVMTFNTQILISNIGINRTIQSFHLLNMKSLNCRVLIRVNYLPLWVWCYSFLWGAGAAAVCVVLGPWPHSSTGTSRTG